MEVNEQYGLPNTAIKKINDVFKTYPQIKRVLIYGSRALGNYRPGSDIDLCIEADQLTLTDLLKIENQLDDLLLPWKIDLSLKHTIDNPSLVHHIEQIGKCF